MSYCREEGKDKLIFTTQEELDETSKDVVRYIDVLTKELDEDNNIIEPVGFVQKNGEVNWGCSCLGNLATGPCAVEFREFQTCLRSSKEEGADCVDQWKEFSVCLNNNSELYFKSEDPKRTDNTDAEKKAESDFSQPS